MTNGTAIGCRGGMLAYGVIWISKKRVFVDYSKWLGPDWKFNPETSYKGAGTFVSNHQGFSDILVQLALLNPAPGYVSKLEVKSVPFIGWIADVILNCLFVSRSDSKNRLTVLN